MRKNGREGCGRRWKGGKGMGVDGRRRDECDYK